MERRRGPISDDTRDVLLALVLVAVGMPIWLADRTWTWLRTGRFPYP